MSRKCVLVIIFLVGATVIFTSLFQQSLTKNVESVWQVGEIKEYKSKELGVSFRYPENLGLSFEPNMSEDGEIENSVSAVVLDHILYLRTKDGFAEYQKNRLESFKEEDIKLNDLVKDIEINGEKVEFKKYVFGDGSPSNECMWSQDSINYVGYVKNLDIFVEIRIEKETTCDSLQEYVYTTNPERIKTIFEVMKTLKRN